MTATHTFRVSKEQRAKNAAKRAEFEPALLAKYGVTFTPKDVSDTEVEVTIEAPSQEVLAQVFEELKHFAPQ